MTNSPITLTPDDAERVLKKLRIRDTDAIAPLRLVDGPEPYYDFHVRIPVAVVDARRITKPKAQ